jgi:L-seryl-tRNA(Ser) seleniumtransferase
VGEGDDARSVALRSLPAVHELAAELDAPHVLAVEAARRAIDEARAAVLEGSEAGSLRAGSLRAGSLRAGSLRAGSLRERARELVRELGEPSLRWVLNATGVIVHTNLGRAPLAVSAQEAVARVSRGYSNLEFSLGGGERGSRQDHVAALLCELTRAEDALVVNNGAAAVLLAAGALAGPGRAVVVSRGQLVEIGGGFRIPEVIAQSGAVLVEVGTTNRTRLVDYERGVASSPAPVGAVLRVHPSNFRAVGFVEEVSIEELCSLGVPVIDDVGSGVLADAFRLPALSDEPALRRSVAAGAALMCCSGDKLLGGPQAGLLVGSSQAVAAARSHPLARAVRIDKLSLAALEATLRLYREPERGRREIPVLAMLDAPADVLAARAERLLAALPADSGEIVRAVGRVGGGALPLLELEGPAVALRSGDPAAVAEALRSGDPPVIGRIHDGRLLLDPRTLADDEVTVAAEAVRAVLERLA